MAILASETLTKQHPDYAAAKTGDIEAAMSLIDELMGRRGALRRVSMLVRRLSPTIVPVHAVESNSINVIPSALAQYIGGAFDLSVEYSILQANRVSHTGSSGYHRLATPPLFAGNVEPGDYLIVDDFVGQGGTLANIRGHIQAQGGHVVGLVTLTGKKRSATLAGESQTLQDLRAQHAALEDWWSEVFGYGFALLTESEARYLLNSPDVDTIRARIAEIAREGDGRPG
ncbi:MAG: hypothetical protein CME59_16310 [Halioglobus sp.]|nr:hypothetical protein [Halioglobus sp.]